MPGTTQPQDSDREAILNDHPDVIDMIVFEQILEMDDDPDNRDFSESIVTGFFEQAESTFQSMDESLERKELHKLSELGHFLKGSSATLGLIKLRTSCEKIQNFGKQTDATGERDEPDDEKSLQNCKRSIADAKSEYTEAEALLKRFFDME